MAVRDDIVATAKNGCPKPKKDTPTLTEYATARKIAPKKETQTDETQTTNR